MTTAPPPKKAKKNAAPKPEPAQEEGQQDAWNPEADCCHRGAADQNHAPGCENFPPPKKAKTAHVLEERAELPGGHAQRVKESRKLLDEPVQVGMRLFEAPDGMIVIGEASQDNIWYREGNDGHGCWINPHRTGKEI